MIRKLIILMIFSLFIIGAVSAHDFKINDGFSEFSEYCSVNDENGMRLTTWDYNDTDIREAYLQNDTDYRITPGDNNTYNVTYNSQTTEDLFMSYANNESIAMDHGILEIAEIDGNKYIIMAYMDEGTDDDWKTCFDELMKFNENNGIEPLANAI